MTARLLVYRAKEELEKGQEPPPGIRGREKVPTGVGCQWMARKALCSEATMAKLLGSLLIFPGGLCRPVFQYPLRVLVGGKSNRISITLEEGRKYAVTDKVNQSRTGQETP